MHRALLIAALALAFCSACTKGECGDEVESTTSFDGALITHDHGEPDATSHDVLTFLFDQSCDLTELEKMEGRQPGLDKCFYIAPKNGLASLTIRQPEKPGTYALADLDARSCSYADENRCEWLTGTLFLHDLGSSSFDADLAIDRPMPMKTGPAIFGTGHLTYSEDTELTCTPPLPAIPIAGPME